jgi:selenocysteine-specific elongation factor
LLAAAPLGLDLAAQSRAEGRRTMPALEGATQPAGIAFSRATWQRLVDDLLAVLDRFHAEHPDELGPAATRLHRLAAPRLLDVAWQALLQALLDEGRLQRHGAWIARPGHAAQLSQAETRIAQKLLPLVEAGGFDPPWLRELAVAAGEPQAQVRAALLGVARRGALFAIVRDLYYHPRSVQRLAAIARDVSERHGRLRAGPFRDATGLGRKRAIQVLEFFDRVGFTRRVGDDHVLRSDAASLFTPEEA